jgi:hypothetical protein
LSFGPLSCYLPYQDGLLFLIEPLNFHLDADQFLLLFCGFAFISFFIPVLHLDLVGLGVALNDLCW